MESVNLDDLARGLHGFGHPIRVRALVLFEFESTPVVLAEALDAPLGVVSYHVRMLRDYGLVELTRTEPRRGALAHFYRRTELADLLLGRVGWFLDLPKPRKITDDYRRYTKCEPIAAGMRLHEALETIEGDLAALSGALKGAAAALELAGSKASAGAARDALRQYGGQ
jgi:DNA-binding transcriptional ArsR family regulator